MYAGVWAVHNLVISPVLVMKTRCLGMWQCQCCVAAVFITQDPASVTRCDELRGSVTVMLQSSRDMQSLHRDTSHTQHFCLLCPGIWGLGGFLVSGLFNIKLLVRCPSRGKDQQWWSVRFSMVKVWPFWHYPGVVWCWCYSCSQPEHLTQSVHQLSSMSNDYSVVKE